MTIKYKFNERELIQELQTYVDGTYSSHYAQGKIQATEVIIDGGHGMGFCIGNVLKYSQRYGHKDGFNRQDLLKTLHYALIALYVHDEEEKERKAKERPHDMGIGDLADTLPAQKSINNPMVQNFFENKGYSITEKK